MVARIFKTNKHEQKKSGEQKYHNADITLVYTFVEDEKTRVLFQQARKRRRSRVRVVNIRLPASLIAYIRIKIPNP